MLDRSKIDSFCKFGYNVPERYEQISLKSHVVRNDWKYIVSPRPTMRTDIWFKAWSSEFR